MCFRYGLVTVEERGMKQGQACLQVPGRLPPTTSPHSLPENSALRDLIMQGPWRGYSPFPGEPSV